MESDQRRVISLLVDNQSGVLARVSSLFCRRGFNIDSLTVSATNDPAVSRITVTAYREKRRSAADPADRAAGSHPPGLRAGQRKSLERELLLLKVMDVHQPRRAAGDRLHLQGKDHRSVAGQHGL